MTIKILLGNPSPDTRTDMCSLWLLLSILDHYDLLGYYGTSLQALCKGLSQKFCHNCVYAFCCLLELGFPKTLLQGFDRGTEIRIGIIEIQCGTDFVFWMPEFH